MEMRDMPEFIQMLTGLGVIYSKPINEPLIDLYWRAMNRYDLPAVKEALQAHIDNPDTGQFMPKPADVVRYLEGSSRTRAMQAWSKVMDAIKHVGAYQSIVFDDPLIHAVIQNMGGWTNLCKVKNDELPFRANEFEKRYVGYVQHAPISYPKQLTGITEHCNQIQGFPSPPPVLIGNQQQALLVYRDGSHNMAAMIHQPLLPLDEKNALPTPTTEEPQHESI